MSDRIDLITAGVLRYAERMENAGAPPTEVVDRPAPAGPEPDSHPELTAADQRITADLQEYVKQVEQGFAAIASFARASLAAYVDADAEARKQILNALAITPQQ
ncbi:hypothetical protein ABT369_09215 [Dactylosporangium sp. NPDC000244]|uniref:hypothetical protein n=1 Tax=Dactylosporangium sp. NPDC000244 TaxID=3154365 RepID=UPI00331B0BDE